MALLPLTSLVFKVRRLEPELVTPAKPTPHECKLLSDIDDQEGHRLQIRGLHFYRCNLSMQGKDPARVIKEALEATLVFYYPFVGRLREGQNRKLMVDCTGEGVLFIEADANVTLEEFGDALHPPFSCYEELLYEVPGSNDVLNCPLPQIQVTHLKCGGFIFARRFNNTMSDVVRFAPDNLGCLTFEILTACLWRCRTKALELGSNEDVHFIYIVNAWSKFNPPLPLGFYGNALGYPAALTTAGKLCQNPLGYAIELVKQAKAKVTEGYMKAMTDLMVIRGRPIVNIVRSFIVSDLTQARFREVDFGWGKEEFGGPTNGCEIISFYIPSKNKEGEEGIAVRVCLPAPVMETFFKELDRMLKDNAAASVKTSNSK
ncbi:hypothetical protein CRYUN_Cryun05aG0050600 [Craigia yunnanensis]